VNFSARADAGSSDAANTGHKIKKRFGVAGRAGCPRLSLGQDET
jgi:hypothetical protein